MSSETVASAVSDINPPKQAVAGEEAITFVVFRQDRMWVARGLERDIASCAPTRADLAEVLATQIEEQGKSDIARGAAPLGDFRPLRGLFRVVVDSATGRVKSFDPDAKLAVAVADDEELALLRKLPEIVEALLLDETSSYCEFCRQHAPKEFPGGALLGPVPHLADCPAEAAHAVLAAIERIREGR